MKVITIAICTINPWSGTSPGKKVAVWWVFIYPAAVHGPCGHICAPKKQKWYHLPDIPTNTTPTNQPCRVTTCTPPPERPPEWLAKRANAKNVAQTTLLSRLGHMVCFLYWCNSFTHSFLFSLLAFDNDVAPPLHLRTGPKRWVVHRLGHRVCFLWFIPFFY
jgi:hypothetical protein